MSAAHFPRGGLLHQASPARFNAVCGNQNSFPLTGGSPLMNSAIRRWSFAYYCQRGDEFAAWRRADDTARGARSANAVELHFRIPAAHPYLALTPDDVARASDLAARLPWARQSLEELRGRGRAIVAKPLGKLPAKGDRCTRRLPSICSPSAWRTPFPGIRGLPSGRRRAAGLCRAVSASAVHPGTMPGVRAIVAARGLLAGARGAGLRPGGRQRGVFRPTEAARGERLAAHRRPPVSASPISRTIRESRICTIAATTSRPGTWPRWGSWGWR